MNRPGLAPSPRAPSAWLAPRFAGWHPVGLIGIAAALLGALLITASLARPAPPAAPVATDTAADLSPTVRLERQRAELEERLSRFPATGQRAAQIAAIASLAAEQGIVIGSGEYRDAPSPMPNDLAVIEVRLPLQGRPAAVRGFVASLQREMPWLAIDHLSIERDGVDWRAEVRGRLLLRGAA